jgi:tetratricopeptide (TPR) repeat protein
MSLFSRLFGKGEQPPAPDALRQALLDSTSDPAQLEALCRQHRDVIHQHFEAWRQVPVELRDRPDQFQQFAHRIIAIAKCFAERLGDPSLLHVLMGPEGSNPVERWQQALAEARREMDQLRYQEAAARLTDLAIDVGRLKGSAVETYLPVILGSLGECYFHTGHAVRAVEPTRQALELVRKIGDPNGIAAYLGNLYELHRYLGQGAEAGACADELAQIHERQERTADARRYRNQARLVRAGEPLLRVIVDLGGQRYEVEEVPRGLAGTARFAFERNRLMLRPAQVLTEQGEREAGQGKFDSALAHFLDAAKADPFAPQPVYEAALTYLYLERPSDAAAAYESTEELAPGWFHCRSEGWLTRQIVAERYDLEDFQVLRALQEGMFDPQVKWQLIERALAKRPDLALYHHQHGKLLLAQNQTSDAEAAFRRGLACAEEPDIQTRLLVELAALASGEERRRLCEQARQINGNLVAAATATLLLAQE